MLDQQELSRAIDMQQRSYLLIKWMASAVQGGFIDFQVAHTYSTLPEAARGWISTHYLNIPTDARPAHEDQAPFCEFFATYLINSFDLVSNPGKQLYSPAAHCFCPMCSWLIDAPRLKTKKLHASDKRRAENIKVDAVASIAAEHRLIFSDSSIAELLKSPEISEDASLVAYGYDLLQRAKGIANGPAVLALWRGFAWNRSGSPKHGYRLRADSMIEAEQRLLTAIKGLGAEH